MSWFNPLPGDPPHMEPRLRPKKIIPSKVHETDQILDLLLHKGTGAVLTDYSGQGQRGRIFNAVWRDGSYGWGLYFNRVNAYVDVLGMAQPAAWTWLAWVKAEALGEGAPTARVIMIYAGLPSPYLIYDVAPNVWTISTGVVAVTLADPQANVEDHWRFVAFRYDGVTARIRAYSLAGLVGEASIIGAHFYTTANLYIGQFGDGTRYFGGLIALPLLLYGVDKGWNFVENYYNRTRSVFHD